MRKIILTILWVLAGLYTRAQTISSVEYFFDADPGYGNGTSVSTPVGSELTNFIFDVPITGVGEGFHVLSIRILDSNGSWSTVTKRTIFKMPAVTVPDPVYVSELEYFFDADPGYGSGTPITVDANSTTAALAFDIPVAALGDGFHTLSIRAKSDNGTWSSVYKRTLFKAAAATAGEDRLLTKLEYFIDTDPGYGNGSDVPFTPATNLSNLMFDVDVTGLSEGSHKLYVRAMDATEIWSTIQVKTLTVCNGAAPVDATATNIAANTFTASWSAVTNATGYQLDVSMDDFTTFVNGYNGKSITNLTEVVSGLTPGTSYKFRVRAVSTCISVNSDAITVETLPLPPSAPVAVAGSTISMDGFTASWNAAATATSYRLDVSADNFATFLSGYEDKVIGGLTETLTGLSSGTTYNFRVRAVNSAGTSPSSNIISVTTLKADQVITFDPLDDVSFGAQPFDLFASSDSGLPVTFASDNTNVATVSGSTVTIHNAGTATITASQTGNGSYNAAPDVQQLLTVIKATQSITFGAPAAHGIGEGTFQLTATASSGLTTTYTSSDVDVATISGNVVTLVAPGTADITASQAGDNNYEAAIDVTQTLTVNAKSAQAITFGALGTHGLGEGTFQLSATTSSGLALTYTSSDLGVATISGNTVTLIAPGTTDIMASQAGDNIYEAAADVTQLLTVTKSAQTITFGPLNDVTFGGNSFSLAATASSGLTVSFASSDANVLAISGNTATIVGAGTVTITALQSGNNVFAGAIGVDQVLTVNKASQSITFAELLSHDIEEETITLAATASSGLGVSFTSSNPGVASVTGNTITLLNTGVADITATQSGNNNYAAATTVVRMLTVFAKANQTITFNSIALRTLGDDPFPLNASSTSGLTVVFTTASDKISIAGSTVTVVKAGRATITANQDGDANFHPAPPVDRDFCINPAKPSITSTGTIEAPLLTSSATSGNQWYLNETAINGAVNQTFTVNAEGSYTVQSKVDDCVSEMSAAKPYIITGTVRLADDVLTAYPNPARKELVVRWGAPYERQVMMLDMLGKQHESKHMSASEVTFNIENLPAGTYLLKGVGNNSIQYFRFTKE